MYKIKKKSEKPKSTILYNIIEDYSEFDAPGNVTACAMTLQEDLAAHAKVLSESYDVPLEKMNKLLTEGGVYVYPQVGGILTRGLFACRIDPTGAIPKQTWTLDLMQFAEAEQLSQARGIPLDEQIERCNRRGVLTCGELAANVLEIRRNRHGGFRAIIFRRSGRRRRWRRSGCCGCGSADGS